MKTNSPFEQKKSYTTPRFTLIVLDNEISLQLESAPPVGPDEVGYNLPNSNLTDNFKSVVV